MIHVTRVARWALVISIAAEALVVRAQVDRGGQSSAPFPDRDAFLARVHAGLRTDEELQSQYTYLENRQEIRDGGFWDASTKAAG